MRSPRLSATGRAGAQGKASLLDLFEEKWVAVSDAGEAAFRKRDG